MMASLFLLMTVTVVLVYFSTAKRAMISVLVTLGLCALMFWHHVTETLKINW